MTFAALRALTTISSIICICSGVISFAMFVVHECNAALQYVSLGFCVSILPKAPAMDNEKVVVLPIADPDNEFSRTVYFSWMKNRPLSPAVKRVRNYIAEHYRLSD